MTTSGTYTFAVTRDDIINDALRVIRAQSERDVCVGSRLTNCARALNILVKGLVVRGLSLWCVQDIAVTTVAAQATYSIGPVSSNPRPLRLLDAYIRDSTGNDTTLTIESRFDYDSLGSKITPGVPNQIYYDPQLTNGVVTVYPVPEDATYTLHFVIQRQYQDFNAATDNPDFPQEAYQMLKWNLAKELYPELGDITNTVLMELVYAQAQKTLDDAYAFWQDSSSVFFTPSERKM